MEHGGAHSLAAAVIETIPTVKEYIDKMIEKAEGIKPSLLAEIIGK